MSRLTKWLMKDKEEAAKRNRRRSMMMSAAALQIQTMEESQWGGVLQQDVSTLREIEK